MKETFKIGDYFDVRVNMNDLVRAQVNYYNAYVRDVGSPAIRFVYQNNIRVNCRIVDFISEPYGKYPKDD